MDKFSKEDWMFLQSHTKKQYRRHNFTIDIDSDDLFQLCAESALKNSHYLGENESSDRKKQFLSTITSYVIKSWVNSENNRKRGRNGGKMKYITEPFTDRMYKHVFADNLTDSEISFDPVDENSDHYVREIDFKLSMEKVLSDRELNLLKMKKEGFTLTEIGQKLNISHQRVAIILQNAIDKLKKNTI